jgi:hypothetical protein
MNSTSRGALRVGLWAAACAALGAVAMWYFSPHLMVDLATRVWACF